MNDVVQQFLQISAKLFQHLTTIPKSDDRDDYIEKIHELLDERGEIIEQLRAANFSFDSNNQAHKTLAELDKGINERLQKTLEAIKFDMKELNKQKKNEQQYTNPYGHVQLMDGMYYDKKK
ncbi:MAG: flagellar protein FliT [Lysinibacillus sp.]